MKPIHIVLLFVLTIVPAKAQEYRADLNVRASTLFAADFREDYVTRGFNRNIDTPELSASIEGVFYPYRFLGIGAFFTRTISEGLYNYDYFNYDPTSYNYSHTESKYGVVMYGLSLHVTTSRRKKFRLYAVGRVGKCEISEDFDEFVLGSKGLAYSAGFGLMKLSRRVYFNIFEANYVVLSKDFVMDRVDGFYPLHGQSGVSVKLYRAK
jgi:hypothetical protein